MNPLYTRREFLATAAAGHPRYKTKTKNYCNYSV